MSYCHAKSIFRKIAGLILVFCLAGCAVKARAIGMGADRPSEATSGLNTVSPGTNQMRKMYTTARLNMRAKPSTQSRVLATLDPDECVYASPAGNDWYQVQSLRGSGYCYGKYLYRPKPTPGTLFPDEVCFSVGDYAYYNLVAMDQSDQGSNGRLYIPEVDIRVRLYWTNLEGDEGQDIVNRRDSAAMFWLDDGVVIGDHKNQGFSGIWNVSVGTKAYIKEGDEIAVYTCVKKVPGENTGHDLVTEDGRPFSDAGPGLLCMYTCNESWEHVTLTYWEKCSGTLHINWLDVDNIRKALGMYRELASETGI